MRRLQQLEVVINTPNKLHKTKSDIHHGLTKKSQRM